MWPSLAGETIYLDTNVIIFAIEAGNPWTELLRGLFQAIDKRTVHALTSELTIAEVLTKPMALGAQDLIEKYDRLLSPSSSIAVVPIDRSILRTAADLRGRLGVKLMDAIHIGTAKACGCQSFLTHDASLGRKAESEIRWLDLPDAGART
jgi:predicted nucleic acid-binding protein